MKGSDEGRFKILEPLRQAADLCVRLLLPGLLQPLQQPEHLGIGQPETCA